MTVLEFVDMLSTDKQSWAHVNFLGTKQIMGHIQKYGENINLGLKTGNEKRVVTGVLTRSFRVKF